MNKPWKVVLAFAAVFAAGSIFGGLLMMRVGQRMVEKRRSQQPPPNPPMVLRHFSEQLDLTAAQKEKIRPMVEKAEEEMRKRRQEALKETGAMLRRLQQEFAAELTPEQRKKLDKLQERQRERMREDRPGMQFLRERMGGKREGPPPEPKKD